MLLYLLYRMKSFQISAKSTFDTLNSVCDWIVAIWEISLSDWTSSSRNLIDVLLIQPLDPAYLHIFSLLQRSLRCFSFAKLYYNVGDYEHASRYIKSYLSVKPKSAEGQLWLGKCLEKLGKNQAALEAYRNCLQLDPKQNKLVLKGKFA